MTHKRMKIRKKKNLTLFNSAEKFKMYIFFPNHTKTKLDYLKLQLNFKCNFDLAKL